jgi:hypothetical protein
MLHKLNVYTENSQRKTCITTHSYTLRDESSLRGLHTSDNSLSLNFSCIHLRETIDHREMQSLHCSAIITVTLTHTIPYTPHVLHRRTHKSTFSYFSSSNLHQLSYSQDRSFQTLSPLDLKKTGKNHSRRSPHHRSRSSKSSPQSMPPLKIDWSSSQSP